MASGYGLKGGPSRCFPFWQEVLACYVVNASPDNKTGASKCAPALDDYYECLHHKKEAARIVAMQQAFRRADLAYIPESPPTAGEIRSLGLIGQDETSKKFYQQPKPKDKG